MEPLKSRVDCIRTAVGSISTCTQNTAIILSDLLLPKIEPQNIKSATALRNAKLVTTRGSKSKITVSKTSSKKTQTGICEAGIHEQELLSAKERSILATEVINATLKSLNDAIKYPPSALGRCQTSRDAHKSSSRKTLRRSNSLPQSPLQSRSLNRVASSPSISNRESQSSSISSVCSSSYRGTAECARLGFACLRTLQAAKTSGIELPPLQLENGMSVLIGKLLSLGLDDLALKELRILKRKLESDEPEVKGPTPKNSGTTAQNLAELLDFGKVTFTGEKLGLIISTQLQVLRLMTTSRNPKEVHDALSILQAKHASSPTRLLLEAAKSSKQAKQSEKIIRQMQSFSEILLALCPSVTSSDDSLALEKRLSVAPEICIQLQTIALHNRFLWWGLAGHEGDLSKEIFEPFLRCLSAFARRSQSTARQTFDIAVETSQDLNRLLTDCSDSQPRALKTIVASIYRLIGSLAKEAGDIDIAIRFTEEIQPLLNPEVDSDARCCSVVARLVSLRLQRPKRDILDEELLLSLLDSLDRGFKGDSSEIDDLMTEISNARRSAINLLAQHRTSTDSHSPSRLPAGIRQMCETLIFLCPRLSLRYIGNTPDTKSATKDIIRYEQRKQFITKSSIHAVDSALFLIKILMGGAKLTWDLLDAKLQDCLLLLGRLDLDSRKPTTETSPTASYYVRISNLYYTQYLDMRRDSGNTKDGQQIKALRRCIDCVRERPNHERRTAQFVAKLERLAEFCKDTARYDELFKTLGAIRDEMIEDGVLAAVVEKAASIPLESAWSEGRETKILGRTVQSLVKVQLKYINSASQVALTEGSWSDEERGAVLEQQLDILCDQATQSDIISKLQIRAFEELVSLYKRDQYPLRRIRVLLRLVSVDCDRRSRILEEALNDLCLSQLAVIQAKNTRDEGLLDFTVHLKTMATTIMELQETQPRFEILKQGLSTWSSIRSGCEDMASFSRQVDNIPDLIAHLHTIADWLQIKGFNDTRVAALRLIADIYVISSSISHPDDLVLTFTELGVQWLLLGYSGKAGLALDKAKSYNSESGVSAYATLHLHVSYCEYLIAIGSLDKVEEHLACAHAIYSQVKEILPRSKSMSMLEQRTKINLLISKAYRVYSILSLETGMAQTALIQAKQSVRLLRRAWANIEDQVRKAADVATIMITSETDKLATEFSQMSVSDSSPTATTAIYAGTSFWTIITPLFWSLNHLSQLYAHHGMFQETMYYAEQAYKLAEQVQSCGLLAISAMLLGANSLKGAALDTGSDWLDKASKLYAPVTQSKDVAQLDYYRGKMYGLLGDHKAEMAAYEAAETMVEILAKQDYIEGIDRLVDSTENLCEQLSQLSVVKRNKSAPKKAAGRTRAPPKGKAICRVKVPVEVLSSVATECPQLINLKSTIMREKARVFMFNNRSAEATVLLQETASAVNTQSAIVEQNLAIARQLLMQSLEQMSSDPVYSVLQDSTISFPSVVGISKVQGDRLLATKGSPIRKNQSVKSSGDRSLSKSPVPESFFDKLREAQDKLTEAHSIALSISPISVIQCTATLLNSVAILLSAAGQVKGKSLAHPGLASSSIEIARNLALHQELKVIQAEPRGCLKIDESCWPQFASNQQGSSSLVVTNDLSQFQTDYVNIIPKPWTVISISISDSHNELSITRLESNHSPFVLRLPLGRHNSMDADEEVFGFEQGHNELLEIIELANKTAHDAKDREGREAKISWWEEREALDTRLRDLLGNIEKVWLGGFTGIFSQHARRPDLLARFQKTFQNILDKHLPSRQKSKKRATGPRINLDSRILELFIGLGDASDEDADFSEPLTDLLYFVVDVLQFHGEFNAYAEIDFDSIVVDTMDALCCYHQADHASMEADEERHTILILDKALHSFPWESLPCIDGLAVSRLPSLACLRDRIITQQQGLDPRMPEGHYIDRDNGSYILNPSGDLKHTQAAFEKNLQSLTSWKGVCNREPSEEEFKSKLEDKDLLLYFGHGSGAQYIRAREIKKLEKCAVTILMGCSSGALVRTGEFEPYGPPINYMHAGCHALVATLWDVTDKDIDRFAKSTFEHWGLWEAEKVGKSKGRKKAAENMSLVEAVAKSRSACKLRYLNAASVCVYGVPVYFK